VDSKIRVGINCLNITLLLSILFLTVTWGELSFTDSIRSITAPVAASATNNLTLLFSTYLGGNEGLDHGHSIAISADGSYYVTGSTESSDFPSLNAYDRWYNGGSDVFLAKFSPNNSLLWSTFFGGSETEICIDLAVARDGSCYIVGRTESTNFPTKNAYQEVLGGNEDVFVAKFSSEGLLLWSTYLGGSEGFENGFGIAVSDDGSCYVTGETQSTDFPTKKAFTGAYNGGNFDAFVAKFSSKGKLLWSTYLGGNDNEVGKAITVARDGSCYVTGWTWSSDFPTKNAFDATPNGDWDCLVTKFSSRGKLLWSTYLGGTWWDEGLGITVARDDSCYVAGFTQSTDFPTKQAYNSTKGRYGDALKVDMVMLLLSGLLQTAHSSGALFSEVIALIELMTLQQLLIVVAILLAKLTQLIFPRQMLLIIRIMMDGMLLFPGLLLMARFSGVPTLVEVKGGIMDMVLRLQRIVSAMSLGLPIQMIFPQKMLMILH